MRPIPLFTSWGLQGSRRYCATSRSPGSSFGVRGLGTREAWALCVNLNATRCISGQIGSMRRSSGKVPGCFVAEPCSWAGTLDVSKSWKTAIWSCAHNGMWVSLFWFEYCGVPRMLASASTISAPFSGVSASRSGSRAATISSHETVLTRFSTCSREAPWRNRTRLNKYAECWFNISWRRRGNDEVRDYSVLEQRR